MDGFYNNGGNYSGSGSGYMQRPSSTSYGSCSNCPGGNCPRMSGGNQSPGMNRQQCCPGGNCCPGGCCPTGRSRSNQDWQNYGR